LNGEGATMAGVISPQRERHGGKRAGVSKWLLFRRCRAMTKKAGVMLRVRLPIVILHFQCPPLCQPQSPAVIHVDVVLRIFTDLNRLSEHSSRLLLVSTAMQCLDRVGSRRVMKKEWTARWRRKQKKKGVPKWRVWRYFHSSELSHLLTSFATWSLFG